MFGELDEAKIEAFKKMNDAPKFKRIRDAQKNLVGISQFQKDSIGKIQDHIDSVNFRKLAGIIKKYGFPKKCAKTYEITTILMHAQLEQMNDAFFKMLFDEVQSGNLPGIEYARLYDRILIARKLPELYYVNERYDEETGKSETLTPVNINETNEARKKIGLSAYK